MSLTVEAGRNTTEATQDEPSLFPEGYLTRIAEINEQIAAQKERESSSSHKLSPEIRRDIRQRREIFSLNNDQHNFDQWRKDYETLYDLQKKKHELNMSADHFLYQKAKAYATPPDSNRWATVTSQDINGETHSTQIPFTKQELVAIWKARAAHKQLTSTANRDGTTRTDTTGYSKLNLWFPPDVGNISTEGLSNRQQAVFEMLRAARAAEWALHTNTPAAQNGFATPLHTLRSLPKRLQKT